MEILGFWCIESHHWQIGIILLPPFLFILILFLSLASLLWLYFLIRHRITALRTDILDLFLTLEEMLKFFYSIRRCQRVCHSVHFAEIFPYLICIVFKNYGMVLNCYQMLSLHIMRWSNNVYHSFNWYSLLS